MRLTSGGCLSTQLLVQHRALLFGNQGYELPSTLKRDDAQKAIMLQDMCRVLPAVWLTACRTYRNGIVTEGLSPLLSDWLAELRTTLLKRQGLTALQVQMGGIAALKTLVSNDLQYATELQRAYIDPGLRASTNALFSRASDIVGSFLNWILLMTIAFIFSLLAFFVLVYSPMITNLDADIKRTRSMLLMFPPEIIQSSPAIRSLMNDVTVQQ